MFRTIVSLLVFFLLLSIYLTLVVSVIYWRESLYRWLENLREPSRENPKDLPHHQKWPDN